MSLVQGSYVYHHYLQEGFNDSVVKCSINLEVTNCDYSWQSFGSLKVITLTIA